MLADGSSCSAREQRGAGRTARPSPVRVGGGTPDPGEPTPQVVGDRLAGNMDKCLWTFVESQRYSVIVRVTM